MSRSRHEYRMVSEYVMRRRTSEDSQASFHHQAHAARANSASPRPSTKSAAHASESSAKSGVEGQWHSSARSAFRMKPSFGTGTDLSPVPVAPTGRVACDADEWLDASTSVCSFSRISIRFPVELAIWRCNASGVEKTPGLNMERGSEAEGGAATHATAWQPCCDRLHV